MGYVIHPILGEIRTEVLDRLHRGELIRVGGVLRIAKGQRGAGQIVAHLRDIGGATPELISNSLKLTQVAAAASVVNIGVTAVGFAVMYHKLHKLQSSVNQLLDLTTRNHGEVMGALAQVGEQLVELRFLALESRDLLTATLDEVRQVRRDILDAYLARVLTEIDLLQRATELDDAAVRDASRVFGEARRWLAQTISANRATRDDHHWFDRLLRFRVWCISGVAEVQLLRRVGDDRRAAELARELASTAGEWCRAWSHTLLPADEFAGPFRFAHTAFAQLDRGVYERIVRLHDGTELGATDPRELDGRMAVARDNPVIEPRWVEQQLSRAALVDFSAEVYALLDTLAVEMELCADERLRFQDWEALPAPSGASGVLMIATGSV